MKGQICQNTIQRGMLTIIVLKYMETMECTSLMLLSAILCMLFLLLTAQRCQNLHLICLRDIEFEN